MDPHTMAAYPRAVRVLAACSLGGAGHLRPLLPLLDAARAGGHQTLLIGPPALAPTAEETGHPFLPGGEPPEEQVRPIREQLPVLPAHEAAVLGDRELFGRLAATAMLPATERVLLGWRPDVVLRDPAEYASAVAGARLGFPAAQVAIGLARVEWGAISIAAPALDAYQKGLADELRQSPYLTRLPGALDPSPFPDTRRYREPAQQPRGRLPAWWPGASGPLVYVTFGTVLGHMSIAEEAYQAAIGAVAGLDARVLLTTGRAFDPDRLRHLDLPGNVHVEAWVDQADVLAEAELVVCHGGSGTTFGALAAGVPLVIAPVFADQFANAPAVAEAGAGVQVVTGPDAQGHRRPLSRVHAPLIREAIAAVLGDSSYRTAAQAVAAEMAAAPALEEVLDHLPRRP
jgi:UDP:flavonoid glycosyltransferase YjiC (YdhE family)